MNRAPIETTLPNLKRIAVFKQHLYGKFPKKGTKEDILSVMRDVAYIQWDPITIVAPSHVLSIWSRVGDFRLRDLEELMWKDKKVFEQWTPILMLMLTEDYPIFHSLMRRFPQSMAGSWGNSIEKANRFIAENADLQKRILKELKGGPLRPDRLKDYSPSKRSQDGWSSDSEVSTMLYYLHMLGKAMVVGHDGNRNVWGLTEDFLPEWVDRRVLSEEETDEAAALRALKAMGPATPREINYYFVRGRYNNLKKTISRLAEEGKIHQIRVKEIGKKEERYIADEDVALLDSIEDNHLEPRVSLISPFDNLICSRDRTNRIFGFDYIHEQFLPKEKRTYGTYVLPILWGEKMVGRIDPRVDRSRGVLTINAVHSEEGTELENGTVEEIGETIVRLAKFLGCERVEFTKKVPREWKSHLT